MKWLLLNHKPKISFLEIFSSYKLKMFFFLCTNESLMDFSHIGSNIPLHFNWKELRLQVSTCPHEKWIRCLHLWLHGCGSDAKHQIIKQSRPSSETDKFRIKCFHDRIKDRDNVQLTVGLQTFAQSSISPVSSILPIICSGKFSKLDLASVSWFHHGDRISLFIITFPFLSLSLLSLAIKQ